MKDEVVNATNSLQNEKASESDGEIMKLVDKANYFCF